MLPDDEPFTGRCPTCGQVDYETGRELPVLTEVALLREALAIYGDRVRMATSCRTDLQQVIDIALAPRAR